MSKTQPPVKDAYAFKSFLGYLEGSGKSLHTIKSYQGDLRTFQRFLQRMVAGGKRIRLAQLRLVDLDRYHEWLKGQGLKSNTRRRKLMTVRKLFVYLRKRKKVSVDFGKKIPTPHKIERFPRTFDLTALRKRIGSLPVETPLDRRNRILLRTLLETGAQVSEVAKIRFLDWQLPRSEENSPTLTITGKNARTLVVPVDLFQDVQSLKRQTSSERLFRGYHQSRPLEHSISSRGIELVVEDFSRRAGFPGLTPRGFRHSRVLEWLSDGKSQDEIQEWLGLKSDYAFRVYRPLFEAKQKEMSTV